MIRGVASLCTRQSRRRRRPQARLCTSSTTSEEDTSSLVKGGDKRPRWLDSRLDVLQRANLFVERNKIHPADYDSSFLLQLIIDCCRLQTLEGMQAARDILDRLRIEQRRLPGVNIRLQFWQKYLYGWACLSQQRVSQSQIQETIALVQADFQQTQGEDDHPTEQLTVDFYNTALQGYVNLSANSNSAPVEAYQLLRNMPVKPNTRSYTLVISAFAASGHNGYGQRAMGVLKRMKQAQRRDERLYEEQFGVPYSSADRKHKIVTADSVAHTMTLKAVLKSNEDPRVVLQLFRDMDESVQLDPLLLTLALGAYRKLIRQKKGSDGCIEIAKEAELVLMNFLSSYDGDKQTTLPAYNAVLDIWSHSRLPQAPEHCQRLLNRMKDDGVEPNTSSLNCCLRSQNSSTEAWELLQSYETTEIESGLCLPDLQSYALAILALRNEKKNPQRFATARMILEQCVQQIQGGRCPPTKYSASPFSAVLLVCATDISFQKRQRLDRTPVEYDDGNAKQQPDAYQIAVHTFRDLREDTFKIGASPDHHAYSAYMKCLVRLCAPDSSELAFLVQDVWDEAKEAGQVSRLVLDAAKRVPGSLDDIPGKQLPGFWSRNVGKEWR